MWQSGDKGSVIGISGYVDTDEAYLDYPAIIKRKGFNGFSSNGNSSNSEIIDAETVAPTVKETNEKSIKITIDGKSYSGTVSEV